MTRRDESYCGCCGQVEASLWCSDCAKHVLDRGALWDRTYFAQTGEDCPKYVEAKKRQYGGLDR